jgi:hypothetical protein
MGEKSGTLTPFGSLGDASHGARTEALSTADLIQSNWRGAAYLQFISSGVAARSLQDALIWLLGSRAKTRAAFAALLVGPNEQRFGLIYQTKAAHL